MNLRGSRNGRRSGDDVNITPVMNLFLVLVPFLLLTTEFVRIAVLELALPSQNQTETRDDRPQRPPILILLAIDEDGIEIKAPNMQLPKIVANGKEQQFAQLEEQLRAIKARYQETEEITIQPVETILYETIVHIMDRCRDNGFPNISVSG